MTTHNNIRLLDFEFTTFRKDIIVYFINNYLQPEFKTI